MTRITLKQLIGKTDTADNAILVLLRDTEAFILRMIRGIVLFYWEWVPDVLCRLGEPHL